LRKIWINVGIYTTTVAWTILSILFSPLAWWLIKNKNKYSDAEAVRDLVWIYGRVWIWCTRLFVPIEVELKTPVTPCILILNHGSFFDTFLLAGQPLSDVCMTIREWPYKMFFFRPFMEAARYLRTENRKPGEITAQAVQELKAGHNMIFFPEGTRTHDGNLGRFRSGAFYAAIQANVPIVPMCISGTYGFLPRGVKSFSYSPIKVKLLPPVYPDQYREAEDGHRQMRKDVKEIMAKELEAMAQTTN